MKKRLSKTLIALLLLVSIFAAQVNVFAASEEPDTATPYFLGIISTARCLEIDTNERATCFMDAELRSGYSAELTMRLQQKIGDSWAVIKNWYGSGTISVTLEKYWYVAPGYDYRLLCEVDVYNSDGDWVEHAQGYSKTVSFKNYN